MVSNKFTVCLFVNFIDYSGESLRLRCTCSKRNRLAVIKRKKNLLKNRHGVSFIVLPFFDFFRDFRNCVRNVHT